MAFSDQVFHEAGEIERLQRENAELRNKLFDNVMAAKKSGYKDGLAWMEAKLTAAVAACQGFIDLREWVIMAGGESGPLDPATINEFAKLQAYCIQRATAVTKSAKEGAKGE